MPISRKSKNISILPLQRKLDHNILVMDRIKLGWDYSRRISANLTSLG